MTRQSHSGGAFCFNQYLLVDDRLMLFHTGPRPLFPLVQEAIGEVLPVSQLRYIALSHFEADEWGALLRALAESIEQRKIMPA